MTIKSTTQQARTELKDFKIHPITRFLMNVAVIVFAYAILFGIINAGRNTKVDDLELEVAAMKKEIAFYKTHRETEVYVKPTITPTVYPTIATKVDIFVGEHKFILMLLAFLGLPVVLIIGQIIFHIFIFVKGKK